MFVFFFVIYNLHGQKQNKIILSQHIKIAKKVRRSKKKINNLKKIT